MKVGIITINNSNYGNRLQNYAVQEILKKFSVDATTIKNIGLLNKKKNNFEYVLRNIKHIYQKQDFVDRKEREKFFIEFNKNISFSSKVFNWFNTKWLSEFDYFLVGSDQVWNPKFRLTEVDLLDFCNLDNRIAFSASFGITELPDIYKEKTKKSLKSFKAISVREDAGRKIVEELTLRTDVEVLVDPTMLLTAEEWDVVSKKPKQLDNMKSKKYILNYFLGELPNEWKMEIDRIAKENKCEIINILDENDPFYETGPSEFLYLEKNAFMVCTDSFHSSVFATIYDTPFVVFNRQQNGVVASMNSRIDTLLSKFNLEDRRFKGSIPQELLKCNYSEAKEILEKEKEKSINFLKKALDIKEGA